MAALRRLALLALLAACDGDNTPGPVVLPPTSYHVAGRWLFSESVADSNLGVSCFDHGLLTVTQNGPRFTGAGVQAGFCSAPGASQDFTDTFTVADGALDGTRVTFKIDICPYTGTAYGMVPDSLAGTVSCSTTVEGTKVSLKGQWRIAPPPDTAPPTVSGASFGGGANDTLETGDDTLYVRVHAQDDNALRTVGYTLTDPSRGVVVRRDSIVFSADSVKVADDTLIFPLPLHLLLPVPANTPFQASLFARDTAGLSAQAPLDPILVRFAKLPTVAGTLAGAVNDTVGALRDTLVISVTASAPRPFTYLGYRITSFVSKGDSVAVSDTNPSHVFRLPIPFAWKGLLLQFEGFARDRLGLEDRRGLGSARVVVFPSRPTVRFPVNQGVADVVYDAARGRVYLATATDSGVTAGTPEVKVFRLSPAASLQGILLTSFPNGLDLSPGGDSLLAALSNKRLGVINLNSLVQDSTDTLPFAAGSGYAFKVRALANGKALVSVAGASAGQLVEVDLTTHAESLRTDVGTAGAIGATPILTRTSDRQRLLVFSSSPSATEGQLYQSSTNQFGTSVAVVGPTLGGGGVSANSTGTLWLLGNSLLGSNLGSVRLLGSGSGPEATPSVLSEDGTLAYLAVPEGVAKYRTSDGVELERILLPDPPYILRITADGNTLIAVGPGLELIDLR